MGGLSYSESGVGKGDAHQRVSAVRFGEVSGTEAIGTTEANGHPASQEQLTSCVTCRGLRYKGYSCGVTLRIFQKSDWWFRATCINSYREEQVWLFSSLQVHNEYYLRKLLLPKFCIVPGTLPPENRKPQEAKDAGIMGAYIKFHTYPKKLVNSKEAVRSNSCCLNRGQKGKKYMLSALFKNTSRD